MLPSLDQITALHKKYAPSQQVYKTVFTHSQIVLDIATQLLTKKPNQVDYELITVGALLHDIGAYRLINADGVFDEKNYVRHGPDGYLMLKQEGLDENLCRVAERHTGVGILKEEVIRRNLPMPVKDYTAESLEEKLIMYADKFHSKVPRFNSFESYKKYILQFGPDQPQKFEQLADLFGLPDLDVLVKKYHHPLV